MVAITLFTLYNYLRRSLLINNSTASFATLLLQAHRKLTFFQQNQKKDQQSTIKSKPITIATAEPLSPEDQHRLHIFYPGRNPILSTDLFFSSPKSIIKQQQQKQKKHKKSYTVDVETIKKQSQSGPITPNYIAPREPIVLCHGLFGFDIRGPEKIPALQFHYWSGVEDTLAKLGAKIIVTKVPQAGSIWERSQALHAILKSILVGKNVNFVAHSMVIPNFIFFLLIIMMS
jgi:triacylglycerol esterase/lipase EstA (alpha/beta hydrolase family)